MPAKKSEQKKWEAQEREWRRQNDAKVLIESQQIMEDKKRLKDAEKYIREEKEKASKTLAATQKVLKKSK